MSGLVIVAGQSNALGFGVATAELPDWARTPDPMVQIWRTDHFETMTPGLNTGTAANPTAWGPEVAFARAWRQEHPGETLYLVKAVKGSTGLANDPGQIDWSPESGELFDSTGHAIAAARAAAQAPVAAILWMQGEQDAIDPAKAAAYRANLADLFLHMRSDWGSADTPIIFGQIGDNAGLAYAEQIRAAQSSVAQAMADLSTILVDSDPFAYQADGLHLNGAGEIALGQAFADALLTPPTPPASEITCHLPIRHMGHAGLSLSDWMIMQ